MTLKDVYGNLKFYVLMHDFNSDEIIYFNIFRHSYIKRYVEKAIKEYKDFNIFKKGLEKEFKYSYWSKSEYEIFVSGWWGKETQKIDIWYQIEPNIDLIARYIITEYNKVKRKKLII